MVTNETFVQSDVFGPENPGGLAHIEMLLAGRASTSPTGGDSQDGSGEQPTGHPAGEGDEGTDQSAGSLLVVSQEFPPDKSGNASRLYETSTALAADGWDVTVLAPPPNFPHGEFDRTWQRKEQSEVDGVTVTRLWAWQPTEPDPGFLSRLSCYVLFALHATLWVLFNQEKYDVVLTTTPPITTGVPGFVASALGSRWVVDVRDLWIDASVSLGFISEDGFLERASRRFQRRVLHTADRIAVTTKTLGEELCAHYGSDLSDKLLSVPNGVEVPESTTDGGEVVEVNGGSTLDSGPQQLSKSRNTSDDERWIAIYTGNIGHAQDLESCIEALQYLPDRVTLRLVGGGDVVPELEALTERLGLEDRVEFLGTVPHEEVAPLLGDAHVGLAPLEDDPELAYAMPSKVYEYLGHSLPVVTTGRGELERFVDESGGGIHAANDPKSVADAIGTLFEDEKLRRRAGDRGYEYVRNHYDREEIALRLSSDLRQLLDPQRGEN